MNNMKERLVLDITTPTMQRLKTLAEIEGVSIGEIIRRSVSIYSFIQQVKSESPDVRILIDRGAGHITELVLPE